MKRKLSGVLTAMALCMGLCPTWAFAEEDAPAAHAAGTPTRTERLELFEMGEAVENTEEGWKWEPNTNTLTLTDCYIKMDGALNIRFPGSNEAHLVLEGDNMIETGSTSTSQIITSDDGKLGLLNVSGNGSLTVTATTPGGSAAPYVFACQALTIEDGVAIRSNMDICMINRDFTMDGGSVTLAGEYVEWGIYTNAGDVIIKDGDLRINAGKTGMFLPGIPPTTRTNNVRISGGTVNIEAPVSAIHINHVDGNPTETEQIAITGGDVSLTAGGRAFQGNEITIGEDAKLDVSVSNGPGLLVPEGRSVGLAAGTYSGNGTAVSITAEGVTLADLLAEGYAFYDENDHLIALEDGQKELPGTATVKQCTHDPNACAYVPAVGDTERHTKTCLACGSSQGEEACTYEYESVDANTHKGVCVCGREKTEEHTAPAPAVTASGTTITVREECAACGLGTTVGTVTFTFPKMAYGQTDGDLAWTRTLPEEYEMLLSVDDGEGKRYDPTTLSQKLAELFGDSEMTVGEHTLRVSFPDIENTEPCELPFTIAPGTLSGTPVFGSGEGKTLGEVEVTLPEGWPEGTFVWTAGDGTQVARGTSYAYTFTSEDGNYTAGGSTVLWAEPYDPDRMELEVQVEEGISQVPEGLGNIPELDTPAKLEAVMRTKITQTGVSSANTAVYDVTLMVSTDGGRTWAPVTKENFPADGRLAVTLPYPEGTDGTYRFTVVHMFTTDDFGKTPGDTEMPAVTNTAQGLRFTVTGLSPVSVGWTSPQTEPGPPSSGGGRGGSRSHAITIEKLEHGNVAANRGNAGSGSTVILTVTPDSGYVLDALTVTDSRGNDIALADQGGGEYTFTMPGRAVVIKAAFAPLADDTQRACNGGADCPSRRFADLETTGAWYHEAVDHVLRNGLMNGCGGALFCPDENLSRAQFTQILFNKEGRPAVHYLVPYRDVEPGAWYTEAICWAAGEGIVGGYDGGMFGPDDAITREQLAAMLWRYVGSPAAADKERHFADADDASGYALEALRWAAGNGILNGCGDGRLAPGEPATRAQAAQMLMNFLKDE